MNRSHVVLVAAAVLAGCDGFRPSPDQLTFGTWGGVNAGVIATDSVTHVHLGCTFGDIEGTVPLDAEGHFDVAGSYVLQAYPIVLGPRLPARFAGQVNGTRLVLTVTVTDTVAGRTQTLGPATVRYGREPEMGPCPICRVPARPADMPH